VGIPGAELEEVDPGAPDLVISRLSCSLRGAEQEVLVTPGTRAAAAYGTDRSTEKFLCRFGVNEAYRARLFGDGLAVCGSDAEGHVRIAEGTGQAFFMGTLFLPQLSSSLATPHPLLTAFVEAAAAAGGRAL
jgi:CTP synthase (UTP-ammonia lyase)